MAYFFAYSIQNIRILNIVMKKIKENLKKNLPDRCFQAGQATIATQDEREPSVAPARDG